MNMNARLAVVEWWESVITAASLLIVAGIVLIPLWRYIFRPLWRKIFYTSAAIGMIMLFIILWFPINKMGEKLE